MENKLAAEKEPEELAEEILDEVDQDFSFDDLTRGTEVYEEDADEEFSDDDPQELDFEPDAGHRGLFEDFGGDEDDY